jgi:helicase required for RNAi-mediated heterochromatin assembly 1
MDQEDEVNSSLPWKLKRTSIKQSTAAFVNKDVRDYFSQPHIGNPDAWTSNSWILKPEIPSSDEILGTEDEFVDLMPNQIEGPWGNKGAYLKAHYELLREDAVAPLRDAVAIVRCDPDMNDDKEVSVYEKVALTSPTLLCRISAELYAGLRYRTDIRSPRACLPLPILHKQGRKTHFVGVLEALGHWVNGCIVTGR